ncbi:unnamed protein product [Linum tenue]|uniref:CRAL-TRIO domain-containing protein n=1 Tax=Linum tenue TaxID=586396 RepID=A0AAV0ILX7_9ROSI|nr:unnamed protein product [Linum tenue]
MALRMCPHGYRQPQPLISAVSFTKSASRSFRFSVRSSIPESGQSRKLVLEVKEKLAKDYRSLPLGKYGRDDEEMILWFLKDRRFSVDEAVGKLTKAIKWRQNFGMSELTEEKVKRVAETGKFDVFYYYYPKRLGEVLFVEAPFVFQPVWQLAKPLLKSYASLVRFCSVETVRKEYFTEETVPTIFKN